MWELFISRSQLCISYIAGRARNYCYSQNANRANTCVTQMTRLIYLDCVGAFWATWEERETGFFFFFVKNSFVRYFVRKKESRMFDCNILHDEVDRSCQIYPIHIIAAASYIRLEGWVIFDTDLRTRSRDASGIPIVSRNLLRLWCQKYHTNFRPSPRVLNEIPLLPLCFLICNQFLTHFIVLFASYF